jgi:ABC-type amino acid transport substrate-binding protein/two-component sensor histidine kinase
MMQFSSGEGMRSPHGVAMTRWLRVIVVLCLALVVATGSSGADSAPDLLTPAERAWLAARPPIVLGAADDWGVLARKDAGGGLSGPLVDYLDLMNRKLGTSIRIEAGPWHEMVSKAEAGKIDGLAVSSPLEERKKHFLFTDVFHESPDFIYLRTDELHKTGAPTDLADLQGKRVGYLKGSLRTGRALAMHPKITPVPLGSYATLAQALLRGELDAVVAVYAFEQWRVSNAVVGMAITRIVHEIDARQVMSINRNEPELVGILNKGIAAISRNELESIQRRWFGADSSHRVAADHREFNAELLTKEERAWLAARPGIVLGAGEDWAATVMKDARGNLSGFMIDYLDLVNRKLGTNVRIEVGPWPEMVRKAESGAIDGLTLTAPLEERRKHFLFTDVFHSSPTFIYLRTDDLHRRKVPLALDDLRGKRVGYLKGTLRESRALARYPEITAVPVDGYAELAQRLLRGELDAVIASYSLEYWRASNGIVGMAVARIVHEIDASMVMSINKERPELVAILNKGVAAVTRTELEEMYRRWFGPDYSNRVAAVRVRLSAEERAWLAGRDVIRVGIDPRWAPVEFVDESGAARGISLAYLERMSKTLGVRFDVRSDLSWAEATQALQDGRLDALAAISSTPSRSRQLRFTDPYLSFPAAIFSAADVTYIGGPEGLNGKVVSVVRGEAIEEWLRENWPDLQLLPVADTPAALKTITDGRAYAFVGNLVTTSYYIGQSGLSQIRVAGETPFVYRIAMGVRSDWPMLAGILQKGIDAIPATERDGIYRDWISIQYQHRFDTTILWMVAGGAMLILLLVFGERTLRLNRANSRLQRLARELTQVEERERRRLAGELHDSPMQKLALAQLQFSAASGEVDSGPAARLANGLGLMREALDELHTLQFELSPPLLYREGLASALEWLAAHATERFDVAISFRDAAPTVKLPQELAIVVFQVARELVYNVAKHAAAKTASITLDADGDHVVLNVADDGKGFEDPSGARRRREGFGLFSARERVTLFGGDLSIATTAAGSRVTVRLPVAQQTESAAGPAMQAADSLQARGDEAAR